MKKSLFCILSSICLTCQSIDRQKTSFPNGGYPFISHIPAKDTGFYMYPLKDVMTKPDSVQAAFYYSQFFPAFNEPNLSLYPTQKPIFRLTYENGYIGYAAVLTMQDGKVTVKEKVDGFPATYYDPDETNLDSLERDHLLKFYAYFPAVAYKRSPSRQRYYDSLAKQYPQLLQPSYFLSLMNKAKVKDTTRFTYRTWRVVLPPDTYHTLVEDINQSEFWQHPYQDTICRGYATHPDVHTLEAATLKQYQMVAFTSPCPQQTKLRQVCEELMQISRLKDSSEKYSATLFQKYRRKPE